MRTPTHVTTRPIVPPSLASPATARSAGRSVALDRLRGMALVAMLLHHLLDWFSGRAREVLPGWRSFVVTDVAAVAFFVVAGASVALFSSARRRRGVPRPLVGVEVLRRYGLLVPIGVAIHVALFRSEYSVGVLEALGVTVVAGAAIASWVGPRALPLVAGVVVAAGAVGAEVLAGRSGWVAEHLFGGTFPLVVYLGLVLVGIAAVRSGLHLDLRRVAWVAAVGVAATVSLLAAGFEPDRYPSGVAFVVPGLAGTAVAHALCQLRWPAWSGAVDRVVQDAGTRALGIFISHYAVFWLLQQVGLMGELDVAVALPLAAVVTAGFCLVAPYVPQLPWSPRTGRRRA